MKRIIKNPRKGVSLVELMVALSIISIISVAAITMMNTAVKLEVKAASAIEASKSVESIIELFRFSNNEEEFDDLCNEYFVSAEISKHSVSVEGQSYKEYTIIKGGYKISIFYYYDVLDEKNIGYMININAKHNDGRYIFADKVYIKG